MFELHEKIFISYLRDGMWAFLRKLLGKTEPQKPKAVRQETTVVKVDIEETLRFVNAAQERRKKLKMNPSADLPAGAIQTVSIRKAENPNSLSKYPVFYLKGTTGQDSIEAFINSNPRARIISFYINGPVQDFQPGKDAASPIYNIVTGEFRLAFEENAFMITAIKHWLRTEHERILKDTKA
jgi:hypothetical protein